jgi:hypothetical protein
VIGEARDGRAALDQAAFQPDVVVMDISIGHNGTAAPLPLSSSAQFEALGWPSWPIGRSIVRAVRSSEPLAP